MVGTPRDQSVMIRPSRKERAPATSHCSTCSLCRSTTSPMTRSPWLDYENGLTPIGRARPIWDTWPSRFPSGGTNRAWDVRSSSTSSASTPNMPTTPSASVSRGTSSSPPGRSRFRSWSRTAPDSPTFERADSQRRIHRGAGAGSGLGKEVEEELSEVVAEAASTAVAPLAPLITEFYADRYREQGT